MRSHASRAAVVAAVLTTTLLAALAGGGPAGATTTVASTPVPSDGANGRVKAVVRAGDRIFVGGEFTAVGGQARSGLAALDAASGRVISTWRVDTDAPVQALAASSDGATLYVGGDFTVVGGLVRRHVAAVSTTTGLVADWNPGAIGGTVLALAADGGRVYIGGKFTSIGSAARRYLAAVSSAGAVDTGFDAQSDDSVWALGMSPDHARLYAGGRFRFAGGLVRPHLAALDPASGRAGAWNPQLPCPVLGMAAVSSAVYVGCAGRSSVGNSGYAFSASNGAQLWVAHGDGNVTSAARVGDAVYLGGHFAKINGVAQKKAVAVDANSGQTLPWDPRPNTALGVWCLYADGLSLWMGGDFTTLNGAAQSHLAHFS